MASEQSYAHFFIPNHIRISDMCVKILHKTDINELAYEIGPRNVVSTD